ncbi:MAG TPA: low affinity iron permease family protein [Pseudolabrys sp.]|nr:low affinity iron permease family protein [Pseudolabrys sp.]
MAHKNNAKSGTTGSNGLSWLREWFSRFAQTTALYTGHPVCFLLAVVVVVVWVVTGPMFNYSDTWQLVINTGTTIVTFLMVFLIQNTQNRDTLSLQLKLSELVLAIKGAENKFAALEEMSDEELHELHEQCLKRAELTLGHIEKRRPPNSKRKNAAHRSKSHKVQS